MPSSKTKMVALKDVKQEHIQRLLENYPEELRGNLQIDPDKLKLLAAHLEDNRSYGLKSRLPLNCKGEECPFARICIYQRSGIAPVGFGCPEEMIVIDQLVPALIKELSVDVENPIELDMIAEFIDAELQEMRAQKTLALDGQIIDGVAAVDQRTGTAITEPKESPSLSVKERAQRRKAQLRKDFMATREIRARYKVQDKDDESQRQAALKKRMEDAYKQKSEEIPFEEVERSAEDK